MLNLIIKSVVTFSETRMCNFVLPEFVKCIQ